MSGNDERPVNPHTGQPVPDDPATGPAASGTPAAGARPAGGEPAGSADAPESAAPSQQELAVRLALETVMDPEIGLSVIDLGLIREIHFHPDRTHVRMMLTTPFCPYAPEMMEQVKLTTMSVVPLECEVELMPDPWSPDLMPDPGLLGYSF